MRSEWSFDGFEARARHRFRFILKLWFSLRSSVLLRYAHFLITALLPAQQLPRTPRSQVERRPGSSPALSPASVMLVHILAAPRTIVLEDDGFCLLLHTPELNGGVRATLERVSTLPHELLQDGRDALGCLGLLRADGRKIQSLFSESRR